MDGDEIMLVKRLVPLFLAGVYLAFVLSWPAVFSTPIQMFILTSASMAVIALITVAARRVCADFGFNGRWATDLVSVSILLSLAMLTQYVFRPEYLTLNNVILVRDGAMTDEGVFLMIKDSFFISLSILIMRGASQLLQRHQENRI